MHASAKGRRWDRKYELSVIRKAMSDFVTAPPDPAHQITESHDVKNDESNGKYEEPKKIPGLIHKFIKGAE
ncbi:hypothetical protein [Magnetospirillum sp. 64-120]|uniref:hypothetical protein n=1 Tax=Magnetospirillum sp. 64-120 TaxID=1895778 RepID=UPI0025BE7D97|nr:hypothetical protein [Magnetospirillum sp. 64-120]